jgi:hypothetical protein
MANADVAVTLQSLGISTAAAQRILDSNAAGKPTFIPQGSLRQHLAQAPSLPVQFPKLIHRYPLLQNTHEVSKWGHHIIKFVKFPPFYCFSSHNEEFCRFKECDVRMWPITAACRVSMHCCDTVLLLLCCTYRWRMQMARTSTWLM